MRASPHVGWSSVARILIVVVLPAPLGPMNPKQSPSLISRFRFDTATSVPYRFVRLTVLIITAIGVSLQVARLRYVAARSIAVGAVVGAAGSGTASSSSPVGVLRSSGSTYW